MKLKTLLVEMGRALDWTELFRVSFRTSIDIFKGASIGIVCSWIGIIFGLYPDWWLNTPWLNACKVFSLSDYLGQEIGCLVILFLVNGYLLFLVPVILGLVYYAVKLVQRANRTKIDTMAEDHVNGIKLITTQFLSDTTRLPLVLCQIINEYRDIQSSFLLPEKMLTHTKLLLGAVVDKIEHKDDLLFMRLSNGECLGKHLPNSLLNRRHSNVSVEVKLVYPHDVVLFLNGHPRTLYQAEWYKGIHYWGHTGQAGEEFVILAKADGEVDFFTTSPRLHLDRGWYYGMWMIKNNAYISGSADVIS